MSQSTSLGQATMTTYIKVEKQDGSVLYYKVVDEQNIEITEQEYLANIKEG